MLALLLAYSLVLFCSLSYGGVNFVDERHRHRYEVCIIFAQPHRCINALDAFDPFSDRIHCFVLKMMSAGKS